MLELIRMSMLRNVPVVLGEQRVGLLQSVCFDKAHKRICALIVSGGVHGKRIVQVQHVRMITQDFILIDQWSKHSRSDKQQISLFVRDTTGLLIGRVTDYAIEKETMNIRAVEIVPGYLPQELRKRTWIYEYAFSDHSDEISIPDILCSGPCFSKEGNIACECPP